MKITVKNQSVNSVVAVRGTNNKLAKAVYNGYILRSWNVANTSKLFL